MAIVKMNKFTLLAFESEKEKLLKKIQSSSEVEFINLQDEEKVEGNEVFESLSKDDLDAETTLIEENVSKTRSALDFLKEFVAERLNNTAKELYGIDNFTDMIGDETIATDPETLVGFLTEKGHPALALEPMM